MVSQVGGLLPNDHRAFRSQRRLVHRRRLVSVRGRSSRRSLRDAGADHAVGAADFNTGSTGFSTGCPQSQRSRCDRRPPASAPDRRKSLADKLLHFHIQGHRVIHITPADGGEKWPPGGRRDRAHRLTHRTSAQRAGAAAPQPRAANVHTAAWPRCCATRAERRSCWRAMPVRARWRQPPTRPRTHATAAANQSTAT
jgi:hypothetical protein